MHRFLFLILLAPILSTAQTVTISVLATTDLHGNIMPYDYYTARPAERGLAKLATLIREARAENPNSLLVDCGDTIQGSPLETVYQGWVRQGKLPVGLAFSGEPFRHDPMMLAMSALNFDAMVVGNHEFNCGLKNFNQARKDAKFPWLSANTKLTTDSKNRPFEASIVKTIAGVKVAFIGVTTPAIPTWDRPEHYAGYRFEPGREAVEAAVKAAGADLVIVGAHAGLERDLKTGAVRYGEGHGENMVYEIATAVKGVDAIVFGHTHQQLEQYRLGDVLLCQPRNWGISLGRLDFVMEKKDGKWGVQSKSSRLIPVTREVAADPEVAALAQPYHELTEKYLQTPVAQAPADMDGGVGRIQDTPLLDMVQQVQLHYAQAQVSLASMFNPRLRIRKGPVTVRELAALYIYDNELYAIEGNGKMLREALENAARYFETCPDAACSHGPLINRGVMGYNFDVAQGVEYEIDLTKPAGQRIQNLRFRGQPLADTQPLRMAINDYRAGGSGGYTMFRGAKVVWRSTEKIRDYMVEFYTERKELPAATDNNWRIVPEAARRALAAEVGSERSTPANR